jgi:hypothetical protein
MNAFVMFTALLVCVEDSIVIVTDEAPPFSQSMTISKEIARTPLARPNHGVIFYDAEAHSK